MHKSSAANMARRAKGLDDLDDYPTPPWATRALFQHVFPQIAAPPVAYVWEPAAGRGHMSKVLKEHCTRVFNSDIHDYGVGFPAKDYLLTTGRPVTSDRMGGLDWVITNPPFKKAQEFLTHTLNTIGNNVAFLCRLQWVEGRGRYARIFSQYPPRLISVFVERVGMAKGRLDPTVSSATAYAWFVWTGGVPARTTFAWIPPCRETLTREGDYS